MTDLARVEADVREAAAQVASARDLDAQQTETLPLPAAQKVIDAVNELFDSPIQRIETVIAGAQRFREFLLERKATYIASTNTVAGDASQTTDVANVCMTALLETMKGYDAPEFQPIATNGSDDTARKGNGAGK